jgi:hypothetical protein
MECGVVRSIAPLVYRHIEVIVSESAGPEVSEAVCRSFGDNRMRFRRNARNREHAGGLANRAGRLHRAAWDELVDDAGSTYDWYLWYLLGRDGAAASYLPEPVYRHRLHGGQETAARVRMGEGFLYCVRKVLTDREEGRAALREARARGAGPAVLAKSLLTYAPRIIALRDTLVRPFR